MPFKGSAEVRRSLRASFLRLACQYLLVSVAALNVAVLMQISEEPEEKGMLGKACQLKEHLPVKAILRQSDFQVL